MPSQKSTRAPFRRSVTPSSPKRSSALWRPNAYKRSSNGCELSARSASLDRLKQRLELPAMRGRGPSLNRRPRRPFKVIEAGPSRFWGRDDVDVLACQLWRNHAVVARFKLGGQGVPRPGAVPGAAHQRGPRVRLPIIDPIFVGSLCRATAPRRSFETRNPSANPTAGTPAGPSVRARRECGGLAGAFELLDVLDRG